MATKKRRRSISEEYHDTALAAFHARKKYVDALYRDIAAALQPRTPAGATAHRALVALHRVAKGRLPLL